MSSFIKGFITGGTVVLVLIGLIFAFRFFSKRDKEVIEYAEMQRAVDDFREDYELRDPAEFLEEPGVRGAADGAAAEFERKRDEAVQRFRSHYAD